MTIRHLYPAVEPSLNLDFANSRKLDSRITFTRGSIGTYVGEDGLIKTAAANEARFDHDTDGNSLGLLIEESRTNFATNSTLESSDWQDYTLSQSDAIIISSNNAAPDGTNTAVLVGEQRTGNFNKNCYIAQNITVSSAGDYIFSVFAKRSSTSVTDNVYIGLTSFTDSNPSGVVKFNWDTLDWVSTDKTAYGDRLLPAENYGNGWYRLGVRCTLAATDLTGAMRVGIAKNSISGGGGTRINRNDDNWGYFWGAQLEQGSFPTSYIPTTSSTVTRSADVASITGTNFSSWYNSSEGTIVSNSVTAAGAAFTYTIHDGIGNNRLGLNIGTNYGQPFATVSGTANTYGTPPTLVAGGGLVAFRYKASDYAAYGNATALTGPNPTSVPTGLNELAVGFRGTYQQDTHLNGHISRLTYYPVRLPDATLQALTL